MNTYAVYRISDDDERLERIGQVSLDAQHRLALLSADAVAETDLREAIGELNEASSLLQKLPPTAGMPKFSIRKEKHDRGDPGFFDALQDNLRRWHGMELVAE